MKVFNFNFKKIDAGEYEMEKDYPGVPLRIFAEEQLLKQMDEEVFIQAKNVTQLPGLAGPVFIMPDAHSGYGAPIGTVFAADRENGYIVPGAIGYDINCGMRLIVSNLTIKEVSSKLQGLINLLFEAIPPGLGRRGFLKINKNELKKICEDGASYLIRFKQLGFEEDIEKMEEKGCLKNADFTSVSKEAQERGITQIATLGSGNHYLEIQKVEKIFDKQLANMMGIFEKDQITIMVHCGSRGLGHQVCSDYLKIFEKNLYHFKIEVPDPQLACLPISSSFGKNYLQAMSCAANFAFANRQAITFQIRKVFEKVFSTRGENLGLKLVYDVAHNIAKFEVHDGKRLLVHRKGATRSFPAQPVIIGGSMETGSYLLVGTQTSLKKSYGSTAHGSGRTMSRAKAKRVIHGQTLWKKLKEKGIYIRSASFSGLAEEAGLAYKNISDVVKSIELAGLSKPVAYFKPIGNIKG